MAMCVPLLQIAASMSPPGLTASQTSLSAPMPPPHRPVSLSRMVADLVVLGLLPLHRQEGSVALSHEMAENHGRGKKAGPGVRACDSDERQARSCNLHCTTLLLPAAGIASRASGSSPESCSVTGGPLTAAFERPFRFPRRYTPSRHLWSRRVWARPSLPRVIICQELDSARVRATAAKAGEQLGVTGHVARARPHPETTRDATS